MLAGLELDEMAPREVRATALAGKVTLPGHHVGLETHVIAGLWPDEPVLPVDNPAEFGGVEDLTGEMWVGRDGLDPVDRRRQVEFGVFEVGE